ncbi:MAG TPA: MBL fold metallo-hydrolase [Pirellulaceae bacterium]|mgnify:CR=1 FL=1|nr:MBL fold metallo-hydrolase [Pirellulaceae bacterium]HMO93385.1 MBL fold metallo-hydrolase [Pirellulaceae bacterium]HMP70445.1 MBL fold metallo-hydrolase [Pirellulaceae bacterium]
MFERKPVFPNVIEVNHQLGHMIGCNVYIVFDDFEWIMIDVGYEETVDELFELVRQLDLPFSKCKTIIATHADVDHIQGLARAKQVLRTSVTAHRLAVEPLRTGDPVKTFASIENLSMPPVEVDHLIDDGDQIQVGGLSLDVWLTPGHTDSQLSFRMGNLLFSGDNIYRDGCVGAIDAHHGSDLVAFINSLQRIKDSDVEWLLPSHGPIFRKNDMLIDNTIKRLRGYLQMADFGACAINWPLLDEFEKELASYTGPISVSVENRR